MTRQETLFALLFVLADPPLSIQFVNQFMAVDYLFNIFFVYASDLTYFGVHSEIYKIRI
jgi:hypothetical protein